MIYHKIIVVWLLFTALLCDASPKSLSAYSETRSFRDALDGKSMEDALVGPVDKDTSSYGDRSSSAMPMVSTPANGNMSPMSVSAQSMRKRMSGAGQTYSMNGGNAAYSTLQQQEQQQSPINQMSQLMVGMASQSQPQMTEQQVANQQLQHDTNDMANGNNGNGLEKESGHQQHLMSPLGKSMTMVSMMRGMNGYGPSSGGSMPLTMSQLMKMKNHRGSSYQAMDAMLMDAVRSQQQQKSLEQGSNGDHSSAKQQQVEQANGDSSEETTMGYDAPLNSQQQEMQKSQQMGPAQMAKYQQHQKILAAAMAANNGGLNGMGPVMGRMNISYGQKVSRPQNTLIDMREYGSKASIGQNIPMMASMVAAMQTINGGAYQRTNGRYASGIVDKNGQKMSPAMVNTILTKMLKANRGAMMKNAALQYNKMMSKMTPISSQMILAPGSNIAPPVMIDAAMMAKMVPIMMSAAINSQSEDAQQQQQQMMTTSKEMDYGSANNDNNNGGRMGGQSTMMDKTSRKMMNAMISAALDTMMMDKGINKMNGGVNSMQNGGYGSRGSRTSMLAEVMNGPSGDTQQMQSYSGGDMVNTTPVFNNGDTNNQQQRQQDDNYEQQQQQTTQMNSDIAMQQRKMPQAAAAAALTQMMIGQNQMSDMKQLALNNGVRNSENMPMTMGNSSPSYGGAKDSVTDMKRGGDMAQQRATNGGGDYSTNNGQQQSLVDNGEQIQQEREPSDEENLRMLEVFGKPGQDFPIYSKVPDTGFSCADQQYPGYYADPEAQCQAFYICQADGRQDGFLCPNATLFNQQHFVCDWWHNVDCSQARNYYNLNADLYKSSGNGASANGGYSNNGAMLNNDGDYRMTDQQQMMVSSIGGRDNGAGASNYESGSMGDQQQPQMMSLVDDMQMQLTPGNIQAGTYNGPMAAANGMRMAMQSPILDMGIGSTKKDNSISSSMGTILSGPNSIMQQQTMDKYGAPPSGGTMPLMAMNSAMRMLAATKSASTIGMSGPMYSSQRLVQQQNGAAPNSNMIIMEPMIGRAPGNNNRGAGGSYSSTSSKISPQMMMGQKQQQQRMSEAGMNGMSNSMDGYSNDDTQQRTQQQMTTNGGDSNQMTMSAGTGPDMGILGGNSAINSPSSYGSKRASQQAINGAGASMISNTTSSPMSQLMKMMIIQRNSQQAKQSAAMMMGGNSGSQSKSPQQMMTIMRSPSLGSDSGSMMSNGKTSPPKSSNLPMMTLDQQTPTTTTAYDRDPDAGFAGAGAAGAAAAAAASS